MLDREVEAGRFRSDLYYRLNVVQFHLPPLRERRDVISSLADRLIREFAAHNGRPVRSLSAAALHALQTYEWPGNIRELRNVIERAVALCPGLEIRLDDLPEVLRPAARATALTPFNPAECDTPVPTLGQAKKEAEAARILEALSKHSNNRLRAAAELGISRMTLYKKLHKYGLIGAA
jgi:DNA-binding NtrC family response regulator